MRDPIVFDDGVRLKETIRVRVPPDFRERLRAAAAAEGVLPTEFARRAIAHRIALRARAPRATQAAQPQSENRDEP